MNDKPEPANLKVLKRFKLADMSEEEFELFFDESDKDTCPHGFTPDEDCDPCDVAAQEAMVRILQDAQREELFVEPDTAPETELWSAGELTADEIAELDPKGQQSLASLLEAFEAARNVIIGRIVGMAWDDIPTAKPEEFAVCRGTWGTGNKTVPIVILARRYIIARDFPNSKESDWEMLWKLKYGGM